jgi:hypothetical protein
VSVRVCIGCLYVCLKASIFRRERENNHVSILPLTFCALSTNAADVACDIMCVLCVCVCVCVCMHACMYVCIYVHTFVQALWNNVCTAFPNVWLGKKYPITLHTYIHTYIHTNKQTYTTYIYIYIHTHIYKYLCACTLQQRLHRVSKRLTREEVPYYPNFIFRILRIICVLIERQYRCLEICTVVSPYLCMHACMYVCMNVSFVNMYVPMCVCTLCTRFCM